MHYLGTSSLMRKTQLRLVLFIIQAYTTPCYTIRMLILALLPFIISQEFEPQDEGDNDDDEIVESEDDDNEGPPAKKLKTDDSDDE